MSFRKIFSNIFKKKATIDDIKDVKLLIEDTVKQFNEEKRVLKGIIAQHQATVDDAYKRVEEMDKKIAEMDKIYVRKFLEITEKLNSKN